MASNHDNPDDPELVDLLYDDELDDQTAGRLRSQLQGSSPEDAAELEAYEQMLERVRETETDEQVPSEVHDSIVDTAREQARQRTEEAAHPEDRTPSPPGKQHTQTIWSRLSSGQTLTWVGTAAAALLACGTILYVMRGELTPPPSEPTAETASKSSPSAPAEGAEAVGEATPETSDIPEPPNNSTESETTEPETASSSSESEERSRNALEMIRGDNSDDSTGAEQPTSADETDDSSRARQKSRKKRTPPSADDGASSDPKAKPTEKTEKRADLDDSPAPESKQPEDESADMIDSFGSGASADSSTGKASDDDQPAVASKSEAAEQTDQSTDGDKSSGSVDDNPLVDVESAYLNDRWAETVKGVDLLLATDDLEPSDEARALELKGRALEQRDKPGEAHSVFSTLAERFPDYKPSEIESAIERTDQDDQEEPAASGAPNNNSGLEIFRGD